MGVRRYMAEYGMTREQFAMVPVVQRQWAALNPRAKLRDPVTVEDVLCFISRSTPATPACPV